ncbi:MAG: SurA N-terminal domain-containing protein [Marivibrio sp.]|uniref:peptidylprolyl isomerase n=1 Tax=Marivibrio sp. TaxID=2039719 RepID=UPI0032EE2A89
MLQSMRKGVASWVAKGVLAIVILSFAGWGLQDYLDASGGTVGGGNVAATVGGQQIGVGAVSEAYRTDLRQMGMQSIDPETARELGLAERTLQDLVTRALFDAEAAELGLTATDAMVRAEIEGGEQFRNQFGQFDRDVFRNAIAAAGLTEQQFVERVRADIARRQQLEATIAGAEANPALVEALFDYHGATRSAFVVRVPAPAASEIPAPTPAELRSFYDANQERFELPEFRRLSYLHLAPQDLLDEVAVPESEIRDLYQSRLATYTRAERRTLQQLLLPDQETAQRAADLLSEGRAFEAVAEEVAGVTPADLDLGTFTRAQIPDATLAETAFSLPEGGVSDPVQGAFGWFLVKVTEVEPGEVTPFEAVRDRIRRDLALDEAIDAVYDLSKRIDDAFGEGLTLEETAERVGLEVETVEAVSRQGRAPSGAPVEGLPPGVSFLETAWNTPVGEPSFLEETANNGYFVLRVDAVIEPRVPDLAEIEDRVEAAWRDDQRDAAAEAQAQALAERARSLGSLQAAVENDAFETRTIEGFGRDGQADGARLPQALAAALFELPPGGVDWAGGEDGGYIVGEVTAVTPAQQAAGADFRANIERSLQAGLQSQIVDQLGAALRRRHDVTINRGALDQVY